LFEAHLYQPLRRHVLIARDTSGGSDAAGAPEAPGATEVARDRELNIPVGRPDAEHEALPEDDLAEAAAPRSMKTPSPLR
jgi:hypothetical protein